MELILLWRARYWLIPVFLAAAAVVGTMGALSLGAPEARRGLTSLPQGGFEACHQEIIPLETPKPRLTLEQRQRKYWPLVNELAQRHQLDPALCMAVIQVESHFRADATSHRGAQGLMQIVPDTAQHLGLEDPLDPAANLQAGITYLARLKRRFKGDLKMTLAAYNAGPTKVEELGQVPEIRETKNYVKRVISHIDPFRQQFMSLAQN